MKRLQLERQYWVLKSAFEELQKEHKLCEKLITDLKKDKDTSLKKIAALETEIEELKTIKNKKISTRKKSPSKG